MADNTLQTLAQVISDGMSSDVAKDQLGTKTQNAIEGLFSTRYHKNSPRAIRVALMPGDDGVSFAGLVPVESQPSGVYSGMSLVWFPVSKEDEQDSGALLTFVCGTGGLGSDERILGRPGHARYLQALGRYVGAVSRVPVWTKYDPANLNQPFPRTIADRYARYSHVIARYGDYIYAAVEVPSDPHRAYAVVQAFLDFYSWERAWRPLKAAEQEIAALRNALRAQLFPQVTREAVYSLLRERRFVILQGPPGTGKTRLAGEVLKLDFSGNGMTVQFHPAVTYETFVAGISPVVDAKALQFDVKAGWLTQAAEAAGNRDFLLMIDEINRADLGRVLGEAIYLFEAREIANGEGREVRLPVSAQGGQDTLTLPQGLYILGTMNTADRSIAILDLAVRRRFAFVDIWPDMAVVAKEGRPLAVDAFGRLLDIFIQYAPSDALVLMPGHAYFLADSDEEIANRLRFELIPLLREYLQEGRLGACESELRAYIDWLEGELSHNGTAR